MTRPAATRSLSLSTLAYQLLPTIGSIGVVFAGVLAALAWLLWVPARQLVPLALVSLPVGLVVGVLEALSFPALVQRFRLLWAFALQTIAHLLVMLALYAALVWLARQYGQATLWPVPAGTTAAPLAQGLRVLLIYALAGFVTTLVRQLLLRINHRQLLPLLLGRYQQPVTETRLFLFVDLKDSTRLAETLGNDQYSRLVRDFFRDIHPAITATHGQVYQYVGDEVVVTWLAPVGLAQANCLRCFFAMQRRIAARQAYYQRTYGTVPVFKAGAHGGLVTTVLVGTAHHELVHHGDVLNTTARIQAQCNALGSKFLISDTLYQQLGPQPAYRFTPLGSHVLRGKAGEVGLLDVQEAPLA